jgi:hypothetical protein
VGRAWRGRQRKTPRAALYACRRDLRAREGNGERSLRAARLRSARRCAAGRGWACGDPTSRTKLAGPESSADERVAASSTPGRAWGSGLNRECFNSAACRGERDNAGGRGLRGFGHGCGSDPSSNEAGPSPPTEASGLSRRLMLRRSRRPTRRTRPVTTPLQARTRPPTGTESSEKTADITSERLPIRRSNRRRSQGPASRCSRGHGGRHLGLFGTATAGRA